MDVADIANCILEFVPDIRAIACVNAWWHRLAAGHDDMVYWRDPRAAGGPKLLGAAGRLTIREIIRLRKYPLLCEFGHIRNAGGIIRAADFGNLAQMAAVICTCKTSYTVDSIFFHAVSIAAAGVVEYLVKEYGGMQWFRGVVRAVYPQYSGVIYLTDTRNVAERIIANARGYPCRCAMCTSAI